MEIIFDEILTGWSAICGGQLVFQKKKTDDFIICIHLSYESELYQSIELADVSLIRKKKNR